MLKKTFVFYILVKYIQCVEYKSHCKHYLVTQLISVVNKIHSVTDTISVYLKQSEPYCSMIFNTSNENTELTRE